MLSTEENQERIAKELLHEKASLWYISDELGFKILIKAPSGVIRGLINGCPIAFQYGKDNDQVLPVLHAGVRIYDDPVHYISIVGVQRFEEEHKALVRIIKNEFIPIQFYNELSVCVAAGVISFTAIDRKQVLNLIGKIENLYTGDFDKSISSSLDSFQYSLDKTQEFNNAKEIETLSIEGTISDWKITDNHFIGINDQERVLINDSKEGRIFESQVWAALESLFNGDIYLRPKTDDKKIKRELTDILAFSEYGIFLVETKALSVQASTNERNMTRKVANVQKQIEKGIEQLKGAAKSIQQSKTIYSSRGKTVELNTKLLPHCIVLVSELLPFGEWKPLVMKMFQAMLDQPMQLHVMDFTEFMRYIGYAKGSKFTFDHLLMQRTEHLVKHQNIHIQISGPNDSLNREFGNLKCN